MKTNKLVLTGIAVAISLLFTACPEQVEELTIAEAEILLTEDANSLTTDLQDMENTVGVKALTYLESLMNPLDVNYDITSKIVHLSNPTKLNTLKVEKYFEGEDVEFGTYTWNFTSLDWDFINTPTDKLIIEFPSDETMGLNNANITLQYTETIIGEELLPNMLIASLTINDVKEMGIELNLSFYSNSYPESATLLVLNNPFEINASYSLTDNTTSYLHAISMEIANNSEVLIGFDFNIAVIGDIFNEEQQAIPTNLDGYFQLKRFKIDGVADIQTLFVSMIANPEGIPSAEALNEAINFDLFYEPTAMKLGDIVFTDNPLFNAMDPNNEAIPYEIKIQFVDGTEANFFDYFETFKIQIEEWLETMDEDGK